MTTSCAVSEANIPTCQEATGLYCCGDHRLHLDKCLSWMDTCYLNEILDEFESKNFSYQTQRNAMITKWETANRKSPYDLDRRFPESKTYLRFSSDALNYVSDMMGALHIRDRVNELLTAHPTLKLSDTFIDKNEIALNNAGLTFKKSILNLKREIASKDSVYDREKFEERYGVKWTNGDLACAKTVKDISHLGAKRCCTFSDWILQIRAANGDPSGHIIDVRNPYRFVPRINSTVLSRVVDIDTNELLPTSPFYFYSIATSGAAGRVWRMEYDDFCILTWTDVGPFTNVNRPSGRAPINIDVNPNTEEEEEF